MHDICMPHFRPEASLQARSSAKKCESSPAGMALGHWFFLGSSASAGTAEALSDACCAQPA